MTDVLDLDAIEARVNAATPGRWIAVQQLGDPSVFGVFPDDGSSYGKMHFALSWCSAEDAALIVAAPTDLRALVNRVRELEHALACEGR